MDVPAFGDWPSTVGLFVPDTNPTRWIKMVQQSAIRRGATGLTHPQVMTLSLVLLRYRWISEQYPFLVDKVMARMSDVPHLAEYREYLGRELSHSYREAARKRLLAFYFRRVDGLCDDVIEKVLESV